MNKLVSIVIPAFNSEKYIKETLESCLSQTYKNIELVIVNDGSNDHTEKIIFEVLKTSDCNINYSLQNNEGLCGARNKGISMANGSFILFLDSDDLLFPNAIEVLISSIEDNDVAIGSWCDFDSQTTEIVREITYNDDININPLFSYLRFKPTVSTALIRKSSLINWDTSLKTWDVTQYFIILFSIGKKFRFINKVVTSIRQHNNSNRLSILNDHFEPTYSSSFFVDMKKLLSKSNILDIESEKELDKEIISYIYQAYTIKNHIFCRDNFQIINIELVKTYREFKKIGLYSFISRFNGFNGLIIFKKINKFFGRT